jgi:hypothetical protein
VRDKILYVMNKEIGLVQVLEGEKNNIAKSNNSQTRLHSKNWIKKIDNSYKQIIFAGMFELQDK